jgi:hypothetical protein
VRDKQCGFKFLPGAIARDLFTRQRIDGYMLDIELLHLAARAGYRVREIGGWRDDADGRLTTGNMRNLADLMRIRFGRDDPPAATSAPAAATLRPTAASRAERW